MTTDDRVVEDLFEELVIALEGGDSGALAGLVAAYPDYEHQLTAFALSHALLTASPREEELASAGRLITADLRALALAAATRSLHIPIDGLFKRATNLGLDARAFAAAVDLPRDLLTKLDRRLIAAQTIPRRCVRRLADELDVGVETVHAYFAGAAPTRVAAFNYASSPPEVAGQDSFSGALAASSLATPSQRALWEQALRDEALA